MFDKHSYDKKEYGIALNNRELWNAYDMVLVIKVKILSTHTPPLRGSRWGLQNRE